MTQNGVNHASRIAERYGRRTSDARYAFVNAEVWQSVQERQRELLRLLVSHLKWYDFAPLKVVEVGCGGGGNLLELLRMGFRPENLTGIELLPERAAHARHILPAAVHLCEIDALSAPIEHESQDIVFQSLVFSSVLEQDVQCILADKMWRWVRRGGGILWYDFTHDNPANSDVCGVPLRRVRELFPAAAHVEARRVTLAPPIARYVAAIHPSLYTLFNALPLLRTHLLCWIQKT